MAPASSVNASPWHRLSFVAEMLSACSGVTATSHKAGCDKQPWSLMTNV